MILPPVGGLVVVRGRGVVRRGGGSVARARGAVDVAPVVAGADVLVEDGVLPALEGVLLPVMVAEVVNLNTVDQQILKVSTSRYTIIKRGPASNASIHPIPIPQTEADDPLPDIFDHLPGSRPRGLRSGGPAACCGSRSWCRARTR